MARVSDADATLAAGRTLPWLTRLLLVRPATVLANLERAQRAGVIDCAPNGWQLTLGVLRMWHRLAFRPETVGTCSRFAVRKSPRAWLLQWRPFRLPLLLAERAVAPWDLTGLLSSPERIVRHLLAAHHDGSQSAYDLEILSSHEGMLEALRERLRAIVDGNDEHGRWLRDLAVFERYHDELLATVERLLGGEPWLSPDEQADPDISFAAYVRWCARQPATVAETWRAWQLGRFSFPQGLAA